MAEKSSLTSSTMIRYLLLMLFLLLTQEKNMVEGKIVTCKNRFSKRQTIEYCTKFGAPRHSHMAI